VNTELGIEGMEWQAAAAPLISAKEQQITFFIQVIQHNDCAYILSKHRGNAMATAPRLQPPVCCF